MRRSVRARLWALAAALALSACRATSPVDVYACEPDGTCPSGGQCCADRFCRASCDAPADAGAADAGPARDAGPATPDASVPVDSGVLVIADGGSCHDGDLCSTNTNPCRAGYAVCATQSCVDSAAVIRSPGEPCGVNKTCTDTGGCELCFAGRSCGSNVNTCRSGITACTTGREVCTDGNELDAGTPCGRSGQCMSGGVCNQCPGGSVCATNPNPCKSGMCSAVSGACSDSATDKPLGTGCDGGFCSGTGACTSCPLGTACTTNPTAPCRKGAWARKLNLCSCEDAASAPDNTNCPGGYCSKGTCVACVNGTSCSNNPCYPATLQYSGGVCQCVPGTVAANGAPCPLGACAAGTCCTGCVLTAGADSCYPGGDFNACGAGGGVCASCNVATSYGPCVYASLCSTTGVRDIFNGSCSAQHACEVVKTGVEVASPACNRVTDGDICSNGCGTFQCGAKCGGGTCSVQCGGAC